MPKKIKIKSHSFIAIDKDYQTLWDDVWLSTTIKPGRKKLYIAPCLVGKKSLEDDIRINNIAPINLEYKRKYIKIMRELSLYGISFDNIESKLVEIYTSKDYIDKKEAEKMISKLMEYYGYDSIKCKWKIPKIYIQSA